MNPMSDTGQKLCGFPKSEQVRLWRYQSRSATVVKENDSPSSYIT